MYKQDNKKNNWDTFLQNSAIHKSDVPHLSLKKNTWQFS